MAATVIVRRVSSLYTQLALDLSTRVRKWTLHHEQLERALFWNCHVDAVMKTFVSRHEENFQRVESDDRGHRPLVQRTSKITLLSFE